MTSFENSVTAYMSLLVVISAQETYYNRDLIRRLCGNVGSKLEFQAVSYRRRPRSEYVRHRENLMFNISLSLKISE
jgi:hypothetical protein